MFLFADPVLPLISLAIVRKLLAEHDSPSSIAHPPSNPIAIVYQSYLRETIFSAVHQARGVDQSVMFIDKEWPSREFYRSTTNIGGVKVLPARVSSLSS